MASSDSPTQPPKNFLRDHKNRYLTDIDSQLLGEDPKLEIFVDSVLQVFDELNERGPDKFHELIDIELIPDDLINHLSALVGWRQTDYNYNYLTYRDLVKNIVRIYKIKGTLLSYEIFFRAIGYEPKIYELWWVSKNNKRELSRTKPIGAPSYLLPNYINNRSNWVEFELDINFAADPAFPDPFLSGNEEFLRIMLDYLKFLKPVHIRYKPILLNIPRFVEKPFLVEKITPVIILGDLMRKSNGINYDLIPPIDDNFALYGLKEQEDVTNFHYNNTIRYGSNLFRSTIYDEVSYPVSVLQREDVKYGASNCPAQEELFIIIGKTKKISEEKIELRYNDYVQYDDNVPYTAIIENASEMNDRLDSSSPEYSFGQGNLFEKP